jgi:AhpC/TSA family
VINAQCAVNGGPGLDLRHGRRRASTDGHAGAEGDAVRLNSGRRRCDGSASERYEARCASSITPEPAVAATLAPAVIPSRQANPSSSVAPTTVKPTVQRPQVILPDLGPAFEFTGISQRVNSAPLTLASLRGKIALVGFWTLGCYNCRNTLPYVTGWYEKYKDQGSVVIGVHTPEFAYELVEAWS